MSAVAASIRGLLWKETRQLIPLIAILIAIGLLIIVAWSLMTMVVVRVPRDAARLILLAFPALYAAGAGALLVGQEKEQKTLWWLVAIPAPPRQIILVKFAVALAGLVVMLVAAWLLTLLHSLVIGVPTTIPTGSVFQADQILAVRVHSIFLLVCGFYTAWRIRSTFAGLVALIPLAIVPVVAVQTVYWVREQIAGHRMVDFGAITQATITLTLIATVIVAVLAYRAALRLLAPDVSPAGVGEAWLEAWRPAAPVSAPVSPFRTPFSSLVWQSIHHRRGALIGLSAALLLGTIGFALLFRELPTIDGSDGYLLPGVLVALLASSWLGVSVFAGDGRCDQIRFLAERGIAPWRVWLGQHLVGVNLLALAAVVYGLITIRVGDGSRSLGLPLPSVAMVMLVLAIVYSVSQWASQTIRIVAASAFVAPVLASIVVYWLGLAAMEFDAPLWLLAVCGLLPMLATWLCMNRYMDGKRGLRIWTTSVAMAIFIALLPMLPMMIRIHQLPKFDPQTRRALLRQGEQAFRTAGVPRVISGRDAPWFDLGHLPNISGEEALKRVEQTSPPTATNFFRLDADNRTSPASIDHFILVNGLGLASKASIEFRVDQSEQSAQAVSEWVDTLTRLARSLRRSRRWLDQQHADWVEIWLTQTLYDSTVRNRLDGATVTAALHQIGDLSARDAARRRAVLASWYESQADFAFVQRSDFGGFQFHYFQDGNSSTYNRRARTRHREAVVKATLALIDAGKSGQPAEAALRQLHDLLIGGHIRYEDGPYSQRFRAAADSPHRWTGHQFVMTLPATQWYARWEQDAAQMLREHDESKGQS